MTETATNINPPDPPKYPPFKHCQNTTLRKIIDLLWDVVEFVSVSVIVFIVLLGFYGLFSEAVLCMREFWVQL